MLSGIQSVQLHRISSGDLWFDGAFYLEGRDVDDLHARVRPEDAQHRQLSADGLARAGGRA